MTTCSINPTVMAGTEVMSLQQIFEPGIQSWFECVTFRASTSIRKAQTLDPQRAGLLSRDIICCWRSLQLSFLAGLWSCSGPQELPQAAPLPLPSEVQLLLRQGQAIHRAPVCQSWGSLQPGHTTVQKQWREDDLEINFLNKQKVLVLPASSI